MKKIKDWYYRKISWNWDFYVILILIVSVVMFAGFDEGETMKNVEYRIVQGSLVDDELEKKVQAHLDDGWEPYGNLVQERRDDAVDTWRRYTYALPMIRSKKQEKPEGPQIQHFDDLGSRIPEPPPNTGGVVDYSAGILNHRKEPPEPPSNTNSVVKKGP